MVSWAPALSCRPDDLYQSDSSDSDALSEACTEDIDRDGLPIDTVSEEVKMEGVKKEEIDQGVALSEAGLVLARESRPYGGSCPPSAYKTAPDCGYQSAIFSSRLTQSAAVHRQITIAKDKSLAGVAKAPSVLVADSSRRQAMAHCAESTFIIVSTSCYQGVNAAS